MSDLDAAVAWAKKTGKGDTAKLGVTGFCWGGRIVWLYAAHNPNLKAGVAWYGRLVGKHRRAAPQEPDRPGRTLKAPVLGLYGGADTAFPSNRSRRCATALKEAKQALGDHRLPRHAARLQRRLPPDLSQGAGRGRLEADARRGSRRTAWPDKRGIFSGVRRLDFLCVPCACKRRTPEASTHPLVPTFCSFSSHFGGRKGRGDKEKCGRDVEDGIPTGTVGTRERFHPES